MDGTKLLNNIQKHLEKIGTDKTTGLPTENTGNMPHEPIAWELMVAGIIRSYGEKRYDAAKAAALAAGVLGKEADAVPGTKVAVYDGAYVTVTRQVNSPASRLDSKKLVTELRKLGVKQDVIDKAIAEATTQAAPAKRYEAMPKS